MVDVRFQLKKLARSALAPLLYRYPPFTLAPERLYLFMHHLIETQTVPGAVVEIGCNLGGSAIIARKMLRRLGMDKSYICIDTFDGFVDAQFVADTARGTPAGDRTMFSGNSRVLVGKIMDQHGCDDVTLIEGDVTTLPDDDLPDLCSVVLVDVDLTEPTLVSLERFWPRLAKGGVILVDDCAEHSSWKARIAYERFCAGNGLPPVYRFGMGVLVKS
ncbi:MAG TPA: class I SAM-dependent methyltransferase [Pseudolabrys sp.]|jgi:O-methyltransferase|nr:class I SAM-dependent methyltransferase [Pseudolabrys sp.]HEX2537095.1 class I SAM-dependent methyltransferase [Pseudolabrys sp.]